MTKKIFDNIGNYLDTLKENIKSLRSKNTHLNFILQNRIQNIECLKYFISVQYEDVHEAMDNLEKQNKIFEQFYADIEKLEQYRECKLMNYFSLVEIKPNKQLNNEEIVSFFNENFTQRVSKLSSSLKMPKFIITRPHFSEPSGNKQFALGWLGIEDKDEIANIKKINLSFRNKFLKKYGGKTIRHVSVKENQYLWNDIFDSESHIVKMIKKGQNG